MAFYHNLITKKSWEILQELKKKYKFILIGGWAVFLYTEGLKSKDIDLICDYKELEKFRKNYDLIKNQRLKKYEIKEDGIDVDIYLPFFSDLGIPVEFIEKHTKRYLGFNIARPEVLLIFKQYAFRNRMGSLKGEKDKIDIISLLQLELDFKFYLKTLKRYKKEFLINELKALLKNIMEVPELNLNRHKFAKFKHSLLEKLKD